MAKITIGDKIIRVLPNNWEQLKKNDVLELVRLTLTRETAIQTRMDYFFFLTKLSRIIPGNDSRFIELETRKGETFSVTPAQLIDMMSPLNFIFNEVAGVVIIASKLRKQLFPFFHLHSMRYAGPDDGLTNISFAEWVEAERHYVNYAQSKRIEHLNLLVATLYRPLEHYKKRNLNDIRMPFNEKATKVRAIILAHLDPVMKYAILLFYEGSRYFIMKSFPNVYSSSSGNKEKSIFGMAEVIEALTNDDPTKFDAVEATGLFKVLLSLENRIKRADKMTIKK